MPRLLLPAFLIRRFAALTWIIVCASGVMAEDSVEYNRDIRQILSDNCYRCHGPDQKAREAELRLDLREDAVRPAESGQTAIVPGKPEKSELVRRVFSADDDERMPPPDSNKKLTDQQKELLKRWIAEGAEYQVHWAYSPLVRPPVPQLSAETPVGNPIDAFIRQQLVARKITPSREADRRTLVRRLSLDLIGLPPTLAEVAGFLQDTSGNAYERQVDRLLKSPNFGERMAVWWLDVARFTDTVGFHGDQNQRIFPYRDYVIEAFNKNKPFDQFTIEQLAGDLLAEPTTEQLVATGFNRLNMMTREGGAQSREYLAKYGAERVRTIGTTWLGSTLACVECHDHKYDPFTARDFYSLQAFFADVKQWGVYSDYAYTPNPELRGWSNDHPFPPELEVESPFIKRRLRRLEDQLAGLVATSVRKRQAELQAQADFEGWLKTIRVFVQEHPDGWETPAVVADVLDRQKRSEKTKTEVTLDRLVRLTTQPVRGEELRLVLQPQTRNIAAVRVELVPDAPGELAAISKLPRQIVRVSATIRSANGKERGVGFYFADANRKEPRYASTVELLGVTDGWLTSEKYADEKHTSVWLLNPPVALAEGESLVVTIRADQSLVPVRVSASPLAARDPFQVDDALLLSAFHAENATAAQRHLLDEAHLLATAADGETFAEYVKLHRQMADCHQGKAWTMITVAAQPLTMRVLPRGNWLDESGPVVEPATPHFLPDIPNPDGRRLTRLDLARWLCSADNPLTARTVINRLWKQLFGNALSGVVDDLGGQGEPPSHPELLDWLAVEFRESGWNVKHVIKLMAMSHTYRQDSNLRRELWEVDPANRLLASQNPRRLDAEFVRDNALTISGLLSPEIGGPSVKPYQPADYYSNLQFPDRKYVASAAVDQWRRGLYMHWQRTFLHPMLANFDAQAREECIANRVVSNTPQQALTLLNDLEFVEAARVFAQRLLAEPVSGDGPRLDRALEVALARVAKPKERESLENFLAGQRAYFRANRSEAEKLVRAGIAPATDGDPIEHAAWMSVARVILNLQETITRY